MVIALGLTVWALCIALGALLDGGRGGTAAFVLGPIGVVMALMWRLNPVESPHPAPAED